MRRPSLLLIAAVLLLTGCTSHDPDGNGAVDQNRPLPAPEVSVSRAAVPAAVTEDAVLPEVSGAFGRPAAIKVPKAKPSGKFVVTDLSRGNGPGARSGDVVVADYTARTWQGRELPSTYTEGTPKVFSVGHGAVIPALERAVAGKPAGSRVLVVAPPSAAYGPSGNTALKVSGTDTVVFVVDIAKVIGAKSMVSGSADAAADGLPRVRLSGPEHLISVPDTTPPKRVSTTALVDGRGARITAGRTVVVQYSAAAWDSNRGDDEAKLFASSWAKRTPMSVVIGRGNVIEGWDKTLVGTRVGSRLLVVVPPGLGYGAQAQKNLPANSTLVLVFDVLAAV
ncbi:FKBP-type peptidyl-prolyl cis-trans isomerase [Streptomyces sp. NPDC058092]|uniref:FKBP-type peptidyl-prolyl cis-trans isomerase n=1 Tax=Streptomyces sp. NPDC058092 TaxID=3346336 RepID=UPI0036EB648D